MKKVRSVLVGLCAAVSMSAFAQGPWPQRPLRIVVPYNAGVAADAMARALGKELARTLGQPVTVDNKPGVLGVIGATAVAMAKADPYVLLMGSSTEIAINPSLYRTISFSSTDLQPVAFAGKLPLVLVTGADSPIGSLSQLLDAARQKPGQITFASAGADQTAHLAMEVIMQKTGAKMLHVPYKGGSEAVMAVVSGQANLFFSGLPPALPQIAGGKLKPLAVSSVARAT